MEPHDWIIEGGRLIDPANHIDGPMDVCIKAGHISLVAGSTGGETSKQRFDARGMLVVPGLIDLHMHGYEHVTPLGVAVDHYCLGRGVTTAIDAGSAGCSTFEGFRVFASQPSRTRLLAFLNISCAGLAFALLGGDRVTPGELDLLDLADLEGCVDCVNANRDLIVGIKIRLSESLANRGRNEAEAYRRALEAARAVRLPLMVHHTLSTVALSDCPGQMGPGDIYTHTYHGYRSTIIRSSNGRLDPEVRRAREQGVLFDVGFGQGSFNWTVAELSAQQGFWPDTTSTDLHSGTCEGPAYDLPTVMTKLLHLGLPLPEVVRSATSEPAKAVGWADRIGSLAVGREANVTVLSLDAIDLELEDCQSQMRRVRERLTPRAVWRSGVLGKITSPTQWPNPATIARQRKAWDHLEVRDPHPPGDVT